MSPSSIRTHISQPSNIISHLPLCVVLNRHVGQLGRDLGDSALGDVADLGEWVDGEFGENAGGGLGAERVEGLEGCLQELLLREVDAEDEDLVDGLVMLFVDAITRCFGWDCTPFLR